MSRGLAAVLQFNHCTMGLKEEVAQEWHGGREGCSDSSGLRAFTLMIQASSLFLLLFQSSHEWMAEGLHLVM